MAWFDFQTTIYELNPSKQITAEDVNNKLISLEEKWQQEALSTKSINFPLLRSSLTRIYQDLGYDLPQFIYFSSPCQLGQYVCQSVINSFSQEDLQLLTCKILFHLQGKEKGLLREITKEIIIVFHHYFDLWFGANFKGKFKSNFETNKNLKIADIDLNLKVAIEKRRSHHKKQDNIKQLVKQIKIKLNEEFLLFIFNYLVEKITHKVVKKALKIIANTLSTSKSNQHLSQLVNEFENNLLCKYFLTPELFCLKAIKFDCYNYICQTINNEQNWENWQKIIVNSGWFIAGKNFCLISDKPKEISINKDYLLHNEGALALTYLDGKGLYAYEGVILPPKYGQIKLENWQGKWLLKENNAELRRVLIQAIGYNKLATELKAEEVDTWAEYTILRFNDIIDDIDKQPICLLKMTCPSTNFIHALRIPPDFTSAREAIRWINWGIDPDDIIMAS
ncbi:hypothetical protein VKI21_06085 [Cyanobacterium aponinum UTEX 3222]|uniref:DUF6745 domain-containing protein n=1 Tax=Cyanobacterium aponinum TaxID=379064 RepID=UPI00308EDF1D|nr:hypothetical protein VKI21_06085 [Cyanobacterium aponinum UTEX 3222]